MKAYIYCTKAKPYLFRMFGRNSLLNEKNEEIEYFIDNGKIVASFDLNKIDTLKWGRWRNQKIFSYLGFEYEHQDLIEKCLLNWQELEEYGNHKPLYFWHIDNLEVIEPLKLEDFGLKKAPQSFQYAYYKGEKVIILSIKSKWVEKIISGRKTIEVRKTAPKEVYIK